MVRLIEETREILLLACKYIERGWTRQAPARNKTGQPVSPYSPEAVSFCLHGALTRAAIDQGANAVVEKNVKNLVEILIRRTYDMSMFRFNDRLAQGKADVIKVLQTVLEQLQ